jgi:hypothetical protein
VGGAVVVVRREEAIAGTLRARRCPFVGGFELVAGKLQNEMR